MGDITETTKDDRQLQLSVVVPLLDEEDNLPALYEQITRALEGRYEYEIVFVDDGSKDGSFQILKDLHGSDPRVRVIRFRRNFGQTAALSAGFAHARGSVIVAMDADLQNDPADIPMLVAKLMKAMWSAAMEETPRQGSDRRCLPDINWLIRGSGGEAADYGCTLKAYRRGILTGTRVVRRCIGSSGLAS
jgi:glycosyltransferase involved in cell wall biosynthesis